MDDGRGTVATVSVSAAATTATDVARSMVVSMSVARKLFLKRARKQCEDCASAHSERHETREDAAWDKRSRDRAKFQIRPAARSRCIWPRTPASPSRAYMKIKRSAVRYARTGLRKRLLKDAWSFGSIPNSGAKLVSNSPRSKAARAAR